MMNEKETIRWDKFKKRHPEADTFYVCRPTGIGTGIVAVAKYGRKRVTRDITDYDSW